MELQANWLYSGLWVMTPAVKAEINALRGKLGYRRYRVLFLWTVRRWTQTRIGKRLGITQQMVSKDLSFMAQMFPRLAELIQSRRGRSREYLPQYAIA